MKSIIKILSLICCALCCTMLCACSSINYGVYIYSNGSIAQIYEITLDEQELAKEGINANELITHVDYLISTHWNSAISGKDMTGIHSELQKNGMSRIFAIRFDSINDYTRFYEISTDDNEPVIESGVFFDKNIIFDGNSPYTSVDQTAIYDEIATFIADNYYSGNKAALEPLLKNITVLTSRVYPTSYRTSSNADSHQVVNGYDIYIWQSDLQTELSTSPKSIKIWNTVYTTKHRMIWYGLAIGITMIFGVILFVVLYKKRKQNIMHSNASNNTATPIQDTLPQLPPKIMDIYNAPEGQNDTPDNVK